MFYQLLWNRSEADRLYYDEIVIQSGGGGQSVRLEGSIDVN